MQKKYFPIRTKTSCQLKWIWSTLYLYGAKTASCHRTGWGQLTADNFDNFHNTDKKIQEREQMLKGQWPSESCSYCKSLEDSGEYSDRMLHLDIPGYVPPELEQDPIAVAVTPTILEVFFDNVCNMGCLYCIPTLSSKINQENSKFGLFDQGGVRLESVEKNSNYEILLHKFWSWMNNNSKTLKRFNVLGGEPFYQEEFYKLLDFLENSYHPDLELGIVTNLMISKEKFEKIIQRLRQMLIDRRLKQVDLTCSIDCWGPEQEFVRHGLDLKTWQENFEYALSHKWLKININQTISILTIKTMPELLKKLQQWRQLRPVGHYFSAVAPQPSYLMIDILGSELFDKDFDYILSLMPGNTDQEKKSQNYMQSIASLIKNSQKNIEEIKKLGIFLDEKDRRRGTNWRQTFPWLEKELKDVV